MVVAKEKQFYIDIEKTTYKKKKLFRKFEWKTVTNPAIPKTNEKNLKKKKTIIVKNAIIHQKSNAKAIVVDKNFI